MRTSTSSLAITWLQPDPAEEAWEFFHHPAKQDFYRRHGITWERIVEGFEHGQLVPYPRSDLIGDLTVLLAYHRYEDYERYLAKAKRGYRANYNKMETDLQRSGSLTLPAPIILCQGQEALLFSGYRRLCLAWNYGMVPYAWLVRYD
ncbi:hypothetical protein [Geobacter sp. DSM 9736]|uniref:hypothetical protein n=1 Tax=Geobacter sp. DSM 9736 TaxID=1277350 RepID=UPI000B502769|nr:hypothetical protein [Geobacter sp. DSM 9736]SNB45240.1 hypothetical protein SAMN06269301_0643 [Geobacter sp. DSM 9736]